jgi:hypothetical protein
MRTSAGQRQGSQLMSGIECPPLKAAGCPAAASATTGPPRGEIAREGSNGAPGHPKPRVLADLRPNSSFRVLGAKLTGRLVALGPCAAEVVFDGGPTERVFETVMGKRVVLPASGRRVTVSLQTEVE